MASSSSSHPRNEQQDAFSGIEPHGKRRRVDESSRLFDVFINHRGPDCKGTLALKLYKSLEELKIRAYLDSEEKELGDSFPSTIEKAIHSASVHIAIFSKRYAESPWCLAELVLMYQSSAKIIPLFYGVNPSDLRYIEKGAYAVAFTNYEKKERYMEKFDEWKEALHSVSFLTGHEISSDFNSSDCQNIVSAVQNEVQRKISLHVAKYPVGLHKLVTDFEKACFEKACFDKIVEDFERQCRTNKGGKEKAQIVGIFGMGGVGKTTLAKELFNRNLPQYKQACFLFDVRDAYSNNRFPSLQSKLLKDLFQQRDGLKFHCTEEGKSHIRHCIKRSNQLSFLIVIDDIDHVRQLEALLIIEMLESSVDSLVIVTTRDVSVLINTGITTAYNLKGMDRDDARELFCWHAFEQPNPANDYENLVNSFLKVCGGLPLSLQVLGSHVHGRDQNYWRLELNKVSKTLPRDIHQRLQISFDALDHEEQQIFMDIACFFVDELKSIAMQVWEASGWSAQHALETLKNKCLVQESIKEGLWIRVGEDRSCWRMHDHLRDLGREMAKGLNNPRRLWHPQHLQNLGFQNIIAQTKSRCFHSVLGKRTGCRCTYFVGESVFSPDTSMCLLWLKLECEDFQDRVRLPSIPSWVPLQNLERLIIRNLHLKTLWQSNVQFQAPTQLKELQIQDTYLEEFSDLSGVSNSLEKITIDVCKRLKTLLGLSVLRKLLELIISNCSELQELSVVHLSCVEKLVLHNCESLKTVSGLSDLSKLVELKITRCRTFEQLRLVGVNSLKRITVDYCLKPTYFELVNCKNLETLSGKFCSEKLASFIIRDCPKLEVLPRFEISSNQDTLTINGCGKLNSLLLSQCLNLKILMIELDLAMLSIWGCPKLEELSFSTCQTCPAKIRIGRCGKLQNITLPVKLVELEIQECRELKTVTAICDPSECLELQELSSVARLSCVQRISIRACERLQTIQGIDDFHALESLPLFDCPELEELPFSTCQTCLAKIRIFRCGKLENITLPAKLVELEIEGCAELRTVTAICHPSDCLELQDSSSVDRLSCLKRITIETCEKLQTIQGIDDFHALESLHLFDCPELEELPFSICQTYLAQIRIVSCGKLQIITLPTKLVELEIEGCAELRTVTAICDPSDCLELQDLSSVARLSCLKCITIQDCEELQIIQGIGELHALESLHLLDCPKLEELPFSTCQTCLAEISIVRCGKLQNITLPTKLVVLEIQECEELKTVTLVCDPSESLEIQELSSVARLSCVQRISIQACEELQIIQGIGELHALNLMQLSYCSNATIRNCIPMLKSLPSKLLGVIGRAVDGALSTLKSPLFSDADAAIEDSLQTIQPELSALILCFAFELNSCTPVDLISQFSAYCHLDWWSDFRGPVEQGEWLITVVITNEDMLERFDYEDLEDMLERYLKKYGVVKYGKKVCIKKGEEWKTLPMLRTIIDRLY